MIFRTVNDYSKLVPVNKAALEDDALSYAALGMLAMLLVKRGKWTVQPKHLQKRMATPGRKIGRDLLNSLIQELEAAGYLRREFKNTSGGASWEYSVFDAPLPVAERVSHKGRTKPKTAEPYLGSPKTASPSTGGPSTGEPSWAYKELPCSMNLPSKEHEYNHTQKTRARAREGVSSVSKSNFAAPSLAEFTDHHLPQNHETWLTKHAPLVSPMSATDAFLAHHHSENTIFASEAELLKQWRGWMRNAQRNAEDRAEKRAARKAASPKGDTDATPSNRADAGEQKPSRLQRANERAAKLGY